MKDMKGKFPVWLITLIGTLVPAFIAYRIGFYGWPTVTNWGGAIIAIGAGLLAIVLIVVNTLVNNKVVRAISGLVLLFGGVAVIGWLSSNGTHLGGVLYWAAIIVAFVLPTYLVWAMTHTKKEKTTGDHTDAGTKIFNPDA